MSIRKLAYGASAVLVLCLSGSKPGYEKTQILHVGLYQNDRPRQVTVKALLGNYILLAGDSVIDTLRQDAEVGISVHEGALAIAFMGRKIQAAKLSIKPANWGSSLMLRTRSRAPEKVISDALTIRVSGDRLLCVNDLFIEHYIAGVVESESGGQRLSEYYKVQSIIARTYALANLDRHLDESFNLCDQTHCQAYRGQCLNKTIVLATNATRGVVIVDPDIQLITAAYSSNCGGKTEDAVNLWGYPTPYLESVSDSFCLAMPHHAWHRQVPMTKWLDWFRMHGYPVDSPAAYSAIVLRCNEERNDVFTPMDSTITGTLLRRAFGFPSAWFTVEPLDSANMLVEGKGYGHGVGLCQEGAIRMTEEGFSAEEVLHHYYTNVHVISLDALDFFRAD